MAFLDPIQISIHIFDSFVEVVLTALKEPEPGGLSPVRIELEFVFLKVECELFEFLGLELGVGGGALEDEALFGSDHVGRWFKGWVR